MKKSIEVFMMMSLGVISVDVDRMHEKRTLLYLLANDSKSGRNNFLYEEKDGDLSVYLNKKSDFLEFIFVRDSMRKETLGLKITAPFGNILKPGIYLNSSENPSINNGTFHFFKDGSVNKMTCNFEIAEIECDENNQVTSLALNFFQKDSDEPLYGCIRYNSSIVLTHKISNHSPLRSEKCFNSALYFTKNDYYITQADSIGFRLSNFGHLTDKDYKFDCLACSNNEEGILVNIFNENNIFCHLELGIVKDETPDFSQVPSDNSIILYSPSDGAGACRIKLKTNIECLRSISPGNFKLLEIVKDTSGKIQKLAFDFKIENSLMNFIEGSLRYQTSIPINLLNPFSN